MNRRRQSFDFVIIVLLVLLCVALPSRAADDAPYVDSKTTKARFDQISAEDMEALRGKKILFASRSFGLNLYGGIRSLAAKDKKYDLLTSYQRFDVFKAGGDLSIIPADIYKTKNVVHFLASYWPHTKRMEEIDTLLRQPPHDFGKQVDIVIVFFHTALPENFDQYAAKMDALRKDFPKITFIYVTAGFMGEAKAKENENAHAWSEKVRARYKGKLPLYDLGAILSDDFRSGHAYCPEYSKDPASVHPNTDLGQTMMAKGFLLLLRDTLHWKPGADTVTAVAPAPAASGKTETLDPAHPDYKAVRSILDANALTKKKVENVAVVENGRVTRLYLQEGGIKQIPASIGQLTELRLLHLYGDRALSLPLLTTVSPEIAKCTKLEELLLNSNDLRALPPEIVKLTNLKALSIADNRLTGLPAEIIAWATKFDPKGLADQKP